MSDSPGLDPELFASADMHAAIAGRDITTVYRLLSEAGIPQRTIAAATGQSQSEVSEILLKGRQVMAYDVLVRICTGLGIPRGMMGLAYDEDIEPVVEPGEVGEVDENMKRRALLTLGSAGRPGAGWATAHTGTACRSHPVTVQVGFL
jgi:transcriptional regulator with XRE-family HTH domain